MKSKMTDVRELLIETMEKLVHGEEEGIAEADRMTTDKAKQIANIGNVLVKSAQAEVNYMKVAGTMNAPTNFVNPDAPKQIKAGDD